MPRAVRRLLKTFIEAEHYAESGHTYVMLWQTIVHMAFIASAVGLGLIDRLTRGAHETEGQH